MADMGEQKITIGRDAKGSPFVSGEDNVVKAEYRERVRFPSPESIDIGGEITALRELLASLNPPDRGKMERALAEAEDESGKADPSRDKIGGALEQAMNYAKQANGFAEQVTRLKPHLERACAWLGENWHKLLAVAGVAV
jgi:hypothetical protein